MNFIEEKAAVDKIHKNQISHVSGESYGNRDYYITTIKRPDGKWRTVKYRTEEQLYHKLYQFYYPEQLSHDDNIDHTLLYDLDEICNVFGFHKDHALFLIKKNTADQNKSLIVRKNGIYKISYAGILWLIAHGCQSTAMGDNEAMMKYLSSFYKGNTSDATALAEFTAKYDTLLKDFDSIKSVAESLIATVNVLKTMVQKECDTYAGKTKAQTASAQKKPKIHKPVKQPEKTWTCKKNDPDLPELTDVESTWTENMRNGIYAAAKKYGTQYATIIKKIYFVMAAEYGINWDETIHAVLEACGKSPDTGITKLRTVAYEPELRTIFYEILTNIDKYMS